MPKRILVVDDHDVVRQGVRLILRSHPEWEIVAEAGDGVEAIDKIASLRPDLVILDISMPGKDGLEVAAQLTKMGTHSKILIFTMHDPKDLISEVKKTGASGYVIKSQAARDLVHAVQEIFDGGVFFPAGDLPSLKLVTEKPPVPKKGGMFRMKPPTDS